MTGSPPRDGLSHQSEGGTGTTHHPHDPEICHQRDIGQSVPRNEKIGLLETVTEIEIVIGIEKETGGGDSG